MPKSRILALDLAKKTGWAESHGGNGVKDFDVGYKEYPGYLWSIYSAWLETMLRKYPSTTHIVYEASLNQRGHAARIANALVAITELIAFNHDIAVKGYHQSTIKLHATGKGNASKAEMQQAAKKRNRRFMVIDDNQVDALWLLDLAIGDLG